MGGIDYSKLLEESSKESSQQLNPVTNLPEGKKTKIDYSKLLKDSESETYKYNQSTDVTTPGLDASKYVDYTGDLKRGEDYNEERAQNQGTGEKFLYDFTKGVGLAATTFLQTGALIPGAIMVASSGEANQIYNNPITQQLQSFNDWMEEVLPNYYSKEELESNNPLKGFIPGTTGSANFWFDKVLKNAGFTVGAIGAGVVANKILGLYGRAVSLGEQGTALAESALGTADDVYGALNKVKSIPFKTTAELIANVTAGAMGEASVEAVHNYNTSKKHLTENWYINHPGEEMTSDIENQIEEDSQSSGNMSFGLNSLLLGFSDYVQFGKLLSGKNVAKNVLRNTTTNELGQLIVDPITKLERVGSGLKNVLTESFEEGAQFGIEKGTQDYYDRKYEGKSVDWIQSLAKGFGESLSTKEGLENWLLGGISGGIFGGVTNIITKQGFLGNELDQKYNNTKQLVDIINPLLINDKLSTLLQGTVRDKSLSDGLETAIKKNDIFEFQNLKHDQLVNTITTAIKLGKFDLFKEKLENLKGLKDEDFKQAFGLDYDGNKKNLHEYIENLKTEADNIKNIYDKVEEKYPDANPLLKDRFVHSSLTINNIDKRIEDLTARVLLESKGEELGKFKKENPAKYDLLKPEIQDLDKLVERRKDFIEAYKDLTNSKKAEAIIKSEIDKAVKQYEKLKKDKIKQSEKAVNPDIQSFYDNHKDKIFHNVKAPKYHWDKKLQKLVPTLDSKTKEQLYHEGNMRFSRKRDGSVNPNELEYINKPNITVATTDIYPFIKDENIIHESVYNQFRETQERIKALDEAITNETNLGIKNAQNQKLVEESLLNTLIDIENIEKFKSKKDKSGIRTYTDGKKIYTIKEYKQLLLQLTKTKEYYEDLLANLNKRQQQVFDTISFLNNQKEELKTQFKTIEQISKEAEEALNKNLDTNIDDLNKIAKDTVKLINETTDKINVLQKYINFLSSLINREELATLIRKADNATINLLRNFPQLNSVIQEYAKKNHYTQADNFLINNKLYYILKQDPGLKDEIENFIFKQKVNEKYSDQDQTYYENANPQEKEAYETYLKNTEETLNERLWAEEKVIEINLLNQEVKELEDLNNKNKDKLNKIINQKQELLLAENFNTLIDIYSNIKSKLEKQIKQEKYLEEKGYNLAKFGSTVNNIEPIEIDEDKFEAWERAKRHYQSVVYGTSGNNMYKNTDTINPDESQQRWFATIEKINFNDPKVKYSLRTLTKSTNEFKLDDSLFHDDNDIKLVLYKEDTPVMVDGKYVYTSYADLHDINYIKEHYLTKGLSDEQIISLMDQLKDGRALIQGSDTPLYFKVNSKSKGILQIDFPNSVVGKIVKSVGEIPKVKLILAETESDPFKPGMVYIDYNGSFVPVQLTKIKNIPGATDVILELLGQLSESQNQKERSITESTLKKLVNYGNQTDNRFRLNYKEGKLYFGENVITPEDLDDPKVMEDLLNFIGEKYLNVDKLKLKDNNKFHDPITKQRWPSYKHFLMSNKRPDGTDRDLSEIPIKVKLKNIDQQQFLSQYLTFDHEHSDKPFTSPIDERKSKPHVKTEEDFRSGTKVISGEKKTPIQVKTNEPAQLKSDLKTLTDLEAKIEELRNNHTTKLKLVFNGLEVVFNKIKGKYTSVLEESSKQEGIQQALTNIENALNAGKIVNYTQAELEAKGIKDIILTPLEEVTKEPEIDNAPADDSGFPPPEDLNKLYEGLNPATKTQINKEIEEIKSFIPKELHGKIFTILGLIDNKAIGQVTKNGEILISDLAVEGTVYHEAFHVVTQMLLTPKERSKLYKQSGQTEEELAEGFREWMLSGNSNDNVTENWFTKLLNFVKYLLGLNPNYKIENLYKAIKNGKFANSKVLQLPNGNFNKEALPTLNVTQTEHLMQGISVSFFNEIFKNDIELEDINGLLNSRDKINALYDNIKLDFNKYYETYIPADKRPLAKKYLDYINNNWIEVKNKHFQYLQKFNFIINEDTDAKDAVDDAETESVNTRDRADYIDSIEFSTKDKMSIGVRLLIQSLPKINERGYRIGSEVTGFPTLTDFEYTLNLLQNKIVGVRDIEKKFQIIQKLQKKVPELAILLKRLKYDAESITPINLSSKKFRLIRQFDQQFTKSKVNSITQVLTQEGIFNLDANRGSLEFRKREEWRNNNKTSMNSPNSFYKIVDNRIVIDKEKLENQEYTSKGFGDSINKSKFKPDNIEHNLQFLSKLGITMIYENNPSEYTDGDKEVIKNAVKNIRDYVINKPDAKSAFKGVNSSINALAQLEAKYNEDIIENQYIRSDGKTIYGISLPHYLSTIVDDIHTYGIEHEELKHLHNFYTEDSVWYNILKENPDAIQLILLGGLDVEQGEGATPDNLTDGDFLNMQINNVFNDKYNLIRAGDKKLEYGFQIKFNVEDYQQIFKNYLTTEYEKVKRYKENALGKDVQFFNIYGKNINLFDNLDIIVSDEDLKDIPKAVDDNIKKVYDYLGYQVTNNMEYVIKHKLFEKDEKNKGMIINNSVPLSILKKFAPTTKDNKITENEFRDLMKEFTLKDMISKIEQTKLFTGNLAFYNLEKNEIIKRVGGMQGTKKIPSVDQATNNWLNNNSPREDGKQVDGTIKCVTVHDVHVSAEEFVKLAAAHLGLSESDPIFEAYLRINETDGQGYITLPEYREFFQRTGDWLDKHEQAYKKAIKGEYLNQEELFYFQPIKPQYFGPKKYDGLYVPFFLKCSFLPLIPSVIKGSQLEHLNTALMDNEIGLMVYESANKVGTKIIDGKVQSLYDKEGNINPDSKWQHDTIYYKYLGIQLDIAPKLKNKVTFGTQFRKLLLSNIANFKTIKINGVDTDPKDVINEWSSLVNKLTLLQRNKIYKELTITEEGDNFHIKNFNVFKEKIIKELNNRDLPDNVIDGFSRIINSNNKVIELTINKDKIENLLFSVVNNQIIKQKMNGDAYVQAASTGFEKKARKFTTLSKEHRGKVEWISNNEELMFYKPDPNKTGKLQVLLPNYFKDVFGITDVKQVDKRLLNLIGFRIPTQGLNSMEAIEVVGFLPKEAGTLIVVPSEITAKTGSDYDIDKLNIFIPHYDTEVDGDKYFIAINKHLKYLYKNDSKLYEKVKLPDDFEEARTKLRDIQERYLTENEYETTLTTGELEVINAMLAIEKSAKIKNIVYLEPGVNPDSVEEIQNRMIELASDVLTAPENFTSLITPNDIVEIRKVVNKIRIELGKSKSDKKHKSYFIKQWIDNAQAAFANWAGKGGVGIVARHNTNHILCQIADLYINKDTVIGKGENAKKIYLNFEKYNKTENKEIALGKQKDANNEHNIGDLISEFLTAYVDIVKDPFMLEINASINTSNIWMYLIRTGVPFETISYFMNQPIILKYLENQKINESEFLNIKSKWGLTRNELINLTKNEFEKEYPGFKGFNNKYTQDDLLKSMKPKNLSDPRIAGKQLQILDDFIHYTDSAKELNNLLNATTQDTKGSGKNLNQAKLINNQFLDLYNRNVFGNLDKIIDPLLTTEDEIKNAGLMQGFYQVVKESEKMYKDIYFTEQPKVREILKPIEDLFLDISKEVFYTQDNLVKVLDQIQRDFILYVITNNKFDNQILNNKITSLFTGTNSLAIRLANIDKKYENNLLVKNLQELIREDRKDIDLVKIFNKRMSVFENNILVEAFKELNNPDTKSIYNDLIYMGILQSGLDNTPNTYKQLIPEEDYFNIANKALANFNLSDKFNTDKFFDVFFKNNSNNKLIVPSIKEYYWSYDNNIGMSVKNRRSNTFSLKENNKLNMYPYLSVFRIDSSFTEEERKKRKDNHESNYITTLHKKVGDKFQITNKLGKYGELKEMYNDGRLSVIDDNNTIHTDTKSNSVQNVEPKFMYEDSGQDNIITNNKIIEGNIWDSGGIPIITTNLGGIHGAGLANQAYKKGLITYKSDGDFGDRNKVITFPVKKVWSNKTDINLLQNSANKLIQLANNNPNKKYSLPLIGLGHGEGNVQEILPIIKQILNSTNNIKLILPTSTTDRGKQGSARTDNSLNIVDVVKKYFNQSNPSTKTSSVSITENDLNNKPETGDIIEYNSVHYEVKETADHINIHSSKWYDDFDDSPEAYFSKEYDLNIPHYMLDPMNNIYNDENLMIHPIFNIPLSALKEEGFVIIKRKVDNSPSNSIQNTKTIDQRKKEYINDIETGILDNLIRENGYSPINIINEIKNAKTLDDLVQIKKKIC